MSRDKEKAPPRHPLVTAKPGRGKIERAYLMVTVTYVQKPSVFTRTSQP